MFYLRSVVNVSFSFILPFFVDRLVLCTKFFFKKTPFLAGVGLWGRVGVVHGRCLSILVPVWLIVPIKTDPDKNWF